MTVFQNNESLRHKLLEGFGEEDVPSRDFFNGLKLSVSVRKIFVSSISSRMKPCESVAGYIFL